MTHLDEFREQTNDLDSEISKGLRSLNAIVTMLNVTAENEWDVDLGLVAGASSVLSDICGRLEEHQEKARALRTAYISMCMRGKNEKSL